MAWHRWRNFVRMQWVCLPLLLGVTQAQAQEEELPPFQILHCETGCLRWVEPTKNNSHTSSIPLSERGFFISSEGYVRLRFTIGSDGRVKNPKVVMLLGPESYAKQTLSSVEGWTYHPATRGGIPVETPWEAEVIYSQYNDTGARMDVYKAYK